MSGIAGALGWVLPPCPPEWALHPEQEREALVRSLAGPYPGPNTRAIAELVADRLIALAKERQRAEDDELAYRERLMGMEGA